MAAGEPAAVDTVNHRVGVALGVVGGGVDQGVAQLGQGRFFDGHALLALGDAAGQGFELDFFAGDLADVGVKLGQHFVQQVAGALQLKGQGHRLAGLTLHGGQGGLGVAHELAAKQQRAGGQGHGPAQEGLFHGAGDQHGGLLKGVWAGFGL